jgi:hypothetical protein
MPALSRGPAKRSVYVRRPKTPGPCFGDAGISPSGRVPRVAPTARDGRVEAYDLILDGGAPRQI